MGEEVILHTEQNLPVQKPERYVYREGTSIFPTSFLRDFFEHAGGSVGASYRTFWGDMVKRIGGRLPGGEGGLTAVLDNYDDNISDPVYAKYTMEGDIEEGNRHQKIELSVLAEMLTKSYQHIPAVEMSDLEGVTGDERRKYLAGIGEGVETSYYSVAEDTGMPSWQKAMQAVTGLDARAVRLAPGELLVIGEYSGNNPNHSGSHEYVDFIPIRLTANGYAQEGRGITIRCNPAVGDYELMYSRFASQDEFRTQQDGFSDVRQTVLISSGMVEGRKGKRQTIHLSDLEQKVESKRQYDLAFG